jgi:N-acyl-D-amino-acid deacylase
MTPWVDARCTIFAVRLLLAIFSVSTIWAASPAEIRSAAARAIALMQASQMEWDDGWSCASCHHQYLPAIALADARQAGVRINETIAATDAEMAFKELSNSDAAVQGSRSIEPTIGEAYKLWAAEASGRPITRATQYTVRRMAGRQKPDGHWDTMDQRPPQSWSPFTTTALVIRSINRYAAPEMASEVSTRVDRGKAWLLSNTPIDTESRTFRLFGLSWSGGPTAVAKADLLKSQHPDGGWSTVDGRPSDAYSTGEALVALSDTAAVPPSEAAWQHGLSFLLKTQQRDGSWHVPTRLHAPAPLSPEYFETGYPYAHDQFLSIMGSSWAVMAFARALGTVTTPALKFESKAQPAAGTTPLMLAVPDLGAMRRLLDQGADPNARAKSNYSALDIAAQYRESAPAINLLVSRGAKLLATPELDDPHPLALAAFAGNVEALTPLVKAGAPVDEPTILGGVLYATPLLLASMTGDIATIKALLDLGADVNKPDREGLTALIWATLANRTVAVRLLLTRGADPNRVDIYGMTALLYAASVDYGDTAIIDLLIAHGAGKKTKSRDGETPLDRANRFENPRQAARLAR